MFTPPSLRGTLQRPTSGGGANWGGAAFDSSSALLFVRAAENATINGVGKNNGSDSLVDVDYSNQFATREGAPSGLRGLPLTHPPYATLTAIDLNRGEIAWQKPVGEGSAALRNHPLLQGVKLPDRLGSDSKGGAIVTAQAGLCRRRRQDLYAFDKNSGRELWRAALPYTNSATPMTYRTRSGDQFIVIATGSGADNSLVAFGLDHEQ